MKNEFEVQCQLLNDFDMAYIEITFSMDWMDWDDIFSYDFEIGKDRAVEIRKCIDNFQIYLNENSIEYTEDEIDSLKDDVFKKVQECIEEYLNENEESTFNKNVATSSLRNNECKFSYNFINKVLDRVRSDHTNLVPDGKMVPKSLDFIDSTNERCFAYIENIYVYSFNESEKIKGTLFGRNSFICGFKDKQSQKIIIITLGYMASSTRSSELKYYQFENVELFIADDGLVYFYDLSEAKVVVQTNCDFIDILLPYHDYYSLYLEELENRNDNQKMTVALDFLHDYYIEIYNLTYDQGSSLIPIRGKTFKFREVQIDCIINNKVEQYSFDGGEIQLLDEKTTNEIYEQLNEQGISIPNDVSFVRFNYYDLGDRYQNDIESLIASGKYDKIQLCYNITGDITRTKRVIDGIEKCLLGDVANLKLVELICSNNTNDMISGFIESNEYKPNEDYINKLKNKYWTLRENDEQIKTIDKIVQMEDKNVDLMLVQGPPGTGKTELILSLIKELYYMDYKVLVTSNVQVACDNIVDRLKNFRNIALKRYSTIKGEKYEKEILKNEQKYIINQVLAGFSIALENDKVINISLDSRDSYNQLLDVKREFDEKVLTIESEKQNYLDSLKEYNDFIAEKERKDSILKQLSEKNNELENNYNSTLNIINSLEKEIKKEAESNKLFFVKLNSIKQLNEEEKEKNSILEAELKTLFDSKEKNNSQEIDIEKKILDDNNQLISFKNILSKQLSLSKCIDSMNYSFIYKQLVFYVDNGCFDIENEIPQDFFDDVFSDIIPLIDSGKFIKNIISNDIDFLQNGKQLSLANFDSIYYKLYDNESCCKIFNKDFMSILKDLKQYYSAGTIKKAFSSLFSFIKINGKSYQKYQEEMSIFNDELKRIYYSFDNLIKSIIEQYFPEDIIFRKKADINEKILKLQGDIAKLEEEQNHYQKEIIEIKNRILIIDNDIDDLTKTLNKNNKKLEKGVEKYNSDYQIYLSEIDNLKDKTNQLEQLNDYFSNIATELEKSKGIFEIEKEAYKEIVAKTNACYEENQDLIEDFESFMQSKEVAKVRCQKSIDSLQNVIDEFNNRVQTLVNAGWSIQDAEDILFSYIAELKSISEINITKNDAEFRYCTTGQGTAFRELFELSDTGKGSIISMTTNQVASLLRSTTNDELTFDYAIIDEASKCTFEDVVISLPRIQHLILIGDFMQLDKLYKRFNQIEPKYQKVLSYSLWDSLNSSTFYQCLSSAVEYNERKGLTTFDKNPMVSVMKKQYRMNKGIFELVKPVYEIHKEFELIDQKQSTFNDLLCLQIDGSEEQDDNMSSYNEKEAFAIAGILKEITLHRDLYPGIKKIGVITGYRAQESKIRSNLLGEKKDEGLEIGTFDRFQGREYDLVLMSLVRTERLGFNSDIRRMNVAISRAKNHLIILGNFDKLLSVAKGTRYENDENYETNKDELEFVTKQLIPRLYNLKKKYPSEELMKKAVMKFLREENNE